MRAPHIEAEIDIDLALADAVADLEEVEDLLDYPALPVELTHRYHLQLIYHRDSGIQHHLRCDHSWPIPRLDKVHQEYL